MGYITIRRGIRSETCGLSDHGDDVITCTLTDVGHEVVRTPEGHFTNHCGSENGTLCFCLANYYYMRAKCNLKVFSLFQAIRIEHGKTNCM